MLNLNLKDVKESGFGVIPAGNYVINVDSAEVKETKDGTGEYINAKLKIVGGEYDGKYLFTMFNIKNKNPKAVEIGLSQLKTFLSVAGMDASGLTSVNDLVGKTAIAVVKNKTDDFGEKAVVSYFKPITAVSKGLADMQESKIPF